MPPPPRNEKAAEPRPVPGPSTLEKAARKAKVAREEARDKEQQAAAERVARQGLERVAKSPLVGWFPEVQWEYVADIPSGAVLVREKDGADVVLGVKVSATDDQGPESWKVGVYSADVESPGPAEWKRVRLLAEAADLGDYLEAEAEQPTPEPEPAKWVQPLGAHDAYPKGSVVKHKGKTWTSTADANVWEPGVYGWEA